MKNLFDDMELAEKFLAGTLTEQEKKGIAQRLDREKDFNQLTQDMSQLIEGIKFTGSKTTIEEKIKRLKEYAHHDETPETQEKPKQKQRYFSTRQISYAIAATVLIFAVSIFAIISLNNAGSPTDLYAQYFEPFDSPGSGLTRSSDNTISLKGKAYEAYDAGDYSLAAELFEQVKPNLDEAIIDLCLANAYMSLENFELAEDVLLHMLKEHADLVTQTKWYLALLYIRENKLEKARASLWEISDSSTYGEKAKKVLKELD
jgi:tetratricopeptide (TPR) repeat protein